MKEKLDNKVYRVTIGMVYHDGKTFYEDEENCKSETLVATDVVSAIEKIKLDKDQYISDVSLITTLTK